METDLERCIWPCPVFLRQQYEVHRTVFQSISASAKDLRSKHWIFETWCTKRTAFCPIFDVSSTTLDPSLYVIGAKIRKRAQLGFMTEIFHIRYALSRLSVFPFHWMIGYSCSVRNRSKFSNLERPKRKFKIDALINEERNLLKGVHSLIRIFSDLTVWFCVTTLYFPQIHPIEENVVNDLLWVFSLIKILINQVGFLWLFNLSVCVCQCLLLLEISVIKNFNLFYYHERWTTSLFSFFQGLLLGSKRWLVFTIEKLTTSLAGGKTAVIPWYNHWRKLHLPRYWVLYGTNHRLRRSIYGWYRRVPRGSTFIRIYREGQALN